MLKHIPNALTLIRLILAPVIAWLFWQGLNYSISIDVPVSNASLHQAAGYFFTATACFAFAALTDFFDGMAARAFNAHSKFGRIIDPIADKALVGLPLLVISLVAAIRAGWAAPVVLVSTAIIIIRDVTMTVVRLRSPDGEGVRVSSLAMWKTALELVVVGTYLVVTTCQIWALSMDGPLYREISPYVDGFYEIWTVFLVITAALSAYTGWQYLRPAKKS